MGCDHTGPVELIEMAETFLRGRNVPEDSWRGMQFRYAENLDGSMWASVCLEIERRGDEWIVTRLDRMKEPLPAGETGFRALTPLSF